MKFLSGSSPGSASQVTTAEAYRVATREHFGDFAMGVETDRDFYGTERE
jgi:hypothetical protein